MLPLRDNVPSRSTAIVNWVLIGVNVAVFLFQSSLRSTALHQLLLTYGMVPAKLNFLQPLSLLTLITGAFLHGGWFHLLSNMWTLFIFGDNVEDRMGHGRYLIFYLLSGVVANMMQALVGLDSRIPAVGASGAIAGVLGAYFLLYPRARVLSLVPIFFLWLVEVPAVVFLGFWFVSQLFSGVFSLGVPASASMGGVAWWAHIGGFVFGLLAVKVFASRRQTQTYVMYPGDYWRNY